MDKLFEYLEKNKVNNFDQVSSKILENLPFRKVIELLEQCFVLSNQNSTFNSVPSLFDFSVNDSLSGGFNPCSELSCRAQQTVDLMKFSILYSNSVLVSNPFDFYFRSNLNFENSEQEYFFRKKFAGSLTNLLLMKPLIKNGKIRINNTLRVLCLTCKKRIKKAEDKIQDKLWKIGKNKIYSELKKTVKIEMEQNSLLISGLGQYMNEDTIVFNFIILPKELKKFSKGPKTVVPNSQVPEAVFTRILDDAINSLMLQKFDPIEGNRFTYLTNNKIESQLIDSLSSYNSKQIYSHNIVKGLAHLTPFIENVNIKKLMNFRKNNPDAFVEYQKSLQKAILETNSCKSEKDFKEALNDIVIPKVNKIEKTFQNNHTMLLIGASTAAIQSLSTLAIGLTTNDGSNILQGFLGAALGCVANCLSQKAIDQSMKENEYYFLWRVKKGL